jgi:ATP-dependent exoDNAse (exonuclease V) beta subunit
MLTNEEVHYCSQCSIETKHIVVLVRDEAANSKIKDFLKGFVKSISVGAFEASMDDFSRHSICEKCGKKTVNDNLT